MRRTWRPLLPRVLSATGLLMLVAALVPMRPICAASPSPAAIATANVPATGAGADAVPNALGISPKAYAQLTFVDNAGIINYLADAIGWYRHQAGESQIVDQPEEVLFYTADQQIGKVVLNLAFEAAHAQVALNTKLNPAGGEQLTKQSAALQGLTEKANTAQTLLAKAQSHLKDLQGQLAAAPKRRRAAIAAEVTIAESEVVLAQSHADALKSMLQYAGGLATADQKSTGVSAQINQLQQSISDSDRADKTTASLVENASKKQDQETNGIVGLASTYFALRRNSQALSDSTLQIGDVSKEIDTFKAPAIAILGVVNERATELAGEGGTGSTDDIKSRAQEYRKLIDLRDLAVAVAFPLSKQQVQLSLYADDLQRWRASIDRHAGYLLQKLAIRLITLLGLLSIVIGGGYVWRFLTERFIKDQHHRRQLQQIIQPVVWTLIVFILIANFATELGSIATIMGLAAAGIALALQNVILSVAGYFFLIGRFGIRAGDRVQIGNTTGDVISIGLVKLTLMELSPQDRQPTGRVVVYSNAVVFQPNGNFFKQAPGMSFIWNEVRLTLAPDCDYRLAEKRLVDAVDEVFARYRDRVQRDFSYLESDLHVLLGTPRPQSRLQLNAQGLDIIVRYPADVRSATQIADEVARRVLDAIEREPGLKLVVPGPANIQQIPQPSPSADGVAPDAKEGATNGEKTVTPQPLVKS